MITFLKILASLAVFAGVLLGTKEVMICEALRVIPGKWFPWIWLGFVAVALLITFLVLKLVVKIKEAGKLRSIHEMTITHVDIPHLIQYRSEIVLKSYYLLRLFLQGIVKFRLLTNRQTSRITINEERLEEVKKQGGRSSESAIRMVRFIRMQSGCSITEILQKDFGIGYIVHDLIASIRNMWEGLSWVVCIVFAAVMGIAWGILGAKMQLGMMHDKPIDILLAIGVCGVGVTPYLWYRLSNMVLEYDDQAVFSAIRENFRKRPHDIDEKLLSAVDDMLPTEQERHRILTAYLINSDRVLEMVRKCAEPGKIFTPI